MGKYKPVCTVTYQLSEKAFQPKDHPDWQKHWPAGKPVFSFNIKGELWIDPEFPSGKPKFKHFV